jgi:hypothetical protein
VDDRLEEQAWFEGTGAVGFASGRRGSSEQVESSITLDCPWQTEWSAGVLNLNGSATFVGE